MKNAKSYEGVQYLPTEDKEALILLLTDDPDLLTDLYKNFKAKLEALEEDETGRPWDEIVDEEIEKLRLSQKGRPFFTYVERKSDVLRHRFFHRHCLWLCEK